MTHPRVLAYAHAYIGHGREAGAETTLANLLESLVDAGWEATVLLSEPIDGVRSPWVVNGVTVQPWTARDDLNREMPRYDVALSHLECSERTVFVAQDVHVPVVQLVHNTMWQTSGYLSQGSQLVVFNSHNVADHHFSPHRPFVVVHPQIDPALYRCEGPHDCTTLVNLYAPKGAATLYALAKRNPRRPFLAVLGGYGDQQIDDRYPNVEFIENTPQMTAEVYARTRVLLMPSVYESFGRVAVEAAASSIPTIAAPTPGLRESLGPDGLFADPSDVESWRSLLNALDKPKAYAAAQKHALSRSAHWDAQRPRETAEFVTAMNQLYGRWEYGSADRR